MTMKRFKRTSILIIVLSLLLATAASAYTPLATAIVGSEHVRKTVGAKCSVDADPVFLEELYAHYQAYSVSDEDTIYAEKYDSKSNPSTNSFTVSGHVAGLPTGRYINEAIAHVSFVEPLSYQDGYDFDSKSFDYTSYERAVPEDGFSLQALASDPEYITAQERRGNIGEEIFEKFGEDPNDYTRIVNFDLLGYVTDQNYCIVKINMNLKSGYLVPIFFMNRSGDMLYGITEDPSGNGYLYTFEMDNEGQLSLSSTKMVDHSNSIFSIEPPAY